jgi:hypothetical protein
MTHDLFVRLVVIGSPVVEAKMVMLRWSSPRISPAGRQTEIDCIQANTNSLATFFLYICVGLLNPQHKWRHGLSSISFHFIISA